MKKAKLISADKKKFEFLIIGDIHYLCRSDGIETILNFSKDAKKVENISIEGITHLGRSNNLGKIQELYGTKYAVVIDNDSVSENHALIYPPDKHYSLYTIQHLNSHNKTSINGKEIPPMERRILKSGYKIIIGPAELEFRLKFHL